MQSTIKECVRQLAQVKEDSPRRGKAAKGAVMTAPEALNQETLLNLGPIVQDHPELAADVTKITTAASSAAHEDHAAAGLALAGVVCVVACIAGAAVIYGHK